MNIDEKNAAFTFVIGAVEYKVRVCFCFQTTLDLECLGKIV